MKKKLVLAVVFLVLAAGVIAPLNAEQQATDLVIDVERTVHTGQYGVVHITDDYSILNNGTRPALSLEFGLPRAYRDNLYYADAKDPEGRELIIEADVNKTSDFYWIRAQFPAPLAFNKTYNFTVTSVFDGLIRGVATGYEYNFSSAPVLTQDARGANATFLAPAGSNFRLPPNTTYLEANVAGFPALIKEYKPWKAYSTETFYAPYTTISQFVLDLKSAEREIVIRNDGVLGVKDKYQFYNPASTISSLTITLPEGAYNVMAYDQVGVLWTTPQNPSSPYQVTVSPRYSLGIRPQESFTFTLTYEVPQSKYLKQLDWWGTYNLTLTFLNNYEDFVFDNATVRIIAPNGFTVNTLKMLPQSPVASPIQVSDDKRTFRLAGITDLHRLSFGVTFKFVSFWSAFEVLPWIVALEIALIAFAAVLKIRRGPELAVPVPVERLREFVGLYDERIALSRELVVMEEDVGRGGLVKHEFRRRRKNMDQRLDELNKSLMEVKVELRSISSRYDDLIRRIDRAEAEIGASRASMSQIKNQYRAGKTTRETYDSMMKEIQKRIDRAEETVETILITLREEAR